MKFWVRATFIRGDEDRPAKLAFLKWASGGDEEDDSITLEHECAVSYDIYTAHTDCRVAHIIARTRFKNNITSYGEK